MTEAVSIGSPSAAQPPSTGCLYTTMLHHPPQLLFHLTGHCWWFVCVYLSVVINMCVFVKMSAEASPCNLSFFQALERLAFSSACPISDAGFTSPCLTGCWYSIRTAAGVRVEVRLFPVVPPVVKWCDTCTGPRSYIKEKLFRVWGTHGSSVYLWSHVNREKTTCVCLCVWDAVFILNRCHSPLTKFSAAVHLLSFPFMTHNL